MPEFVSALYGATIWMRGRIAAAKNVPERFVVAST
jgi:hypothetical protein